LREATATRSGEQLRELSRHQRQLVYALVQQARRLANAAGRKVSEDYTELGPWDPPRRTRGDGRLTLPGSVATLLESHVADFVPDDPDALVFGTASGQFVQRHNFGATFRRAVKRCGLPHTRGHWLRHTGATLAASTGATTKELMHRLGHASPAAALVYQHAVSERDSEIARALDAMVTGDVTSLPERRRARRTQRA
jgi:hypothetical protein